MNLKWMLRKSFIVTTIIGIVLVSAGTVQAAAQIEQEDNNAASTATYIDVNTEVTGALANSNDLDYYQFTLDNPSVVNISYDYSSGIPNMKLRLYNSEKKELFVNTYSSSDQTFPHSSNRYNLPEGSYYILIESYFGNNKNLDDYILTVYSEECEANREVEYNESKNTATEIEVNDMIIGNLSNSDDLDYYTFTIPENGIVSITYDYLEGVPNMKMYLYDINGKDKVWTYSSDKDVFPFKTNQYRLPAGTYYIGIVSYFGNNKNNGDYTIEVNYTDESRGSYEIEYNDTMSLATEIALNKKTTGNISDSEDKDYYRINLNKTTDVNFIFDYPQGVANVKVFLYNSKSENINTTVFSSSNDVYPYILPVNKLEAGSYYILVESYFGNSKNNSNYSLTASTGSASDNSGTIAKPGKTSIRSVLNNSKGKAMIKYNRVSGVTGYQIMYSRNRSFSGASSFTTKNTTANITKLRKGSNYYFKVRTYSKQNGKTTYSAYSSVKSIRIRR